MMTELKEVTTKILSILKIDDISQFIEGVEKCVFGNNSSEIFDEYISCFPDLTVDWMQRIYQFYHADREGLKQDYTPMSLSRLVAYLTESGEAPQKVLDCCAGSGSLSIQKWSLNKKDSFVCEELDDKVIPVLLFNLSIRNMEAVVINKNVLTGDVFNGYKVTRGNKYSNIEKLIFAPEYEMQEVCISNPPFNLKKQPYKKEIDESDTGVLSANYAFVVSGIMRSKKLSAFILPQSVLGDDHDIAIRKFLCEKGWLKSVIIMPERMFESTTIATCILFFDKSKGDTNVMLVDASQIKTVETFYQRGEASNYNRLYEKKLNVLTDVQIKAICSLTEIEQDLYSQKVTLEEVRKKGYDLNKGKYQIPFKKNILHRDFNAILSDINRIIRLRNVIKITVNKKWAEELGLTDLENLMKKTNECTKQINESLLLFKNYEVKEKMLEANYFRISDCKVFVIENTDKEMLSFMMPFFFNSYKLHLSFLNTEENRLLAELRDAMLPHLMNGDLEIS